MKSMIFTVNKLEVKLLIIFLVFWIPGYLGLFSPAIEGVYNEDEPIVLIFTLPVVLLTVFLVGFLIRSLYLFKLEISAEGITQTATFSNWHVNWDDIESWEYKKDSDNEDEIVLHIHNSLDEKRIHPFFLSKKNTTVIISLISDSIGSPRDRQK